MVSHSEWPSPIESSESLAQRIRRHALGMMSRGKSSHVGSVLSMADVIAVLYGRVLRIDPAQPQRPDRDRFVLSKGHAGAGVYAALAERGFFPVHELASYCHNGSRLSGHVTHRGVPGVELSTVSLGQGLSVAAGMALAAKVDGKDYRVFVVQSDEECDEGSVWEAISFASHHRLDNLTVVVETPVAETLTLEPFADKWRSLGWEVVEVDGHDHAALTVQLERVPFTAGKQSVLLAHTTKGKDVSFMENKVVGL